MCLLGCATTDTCLIDFSQLRDRSSQCRVQYEQDLMIVYYLFINTQPVRWPLSETGFRCSNRIQMLKLDSVAQTGFGCSNWIQMLKLDSDAQTGFRCSNRIRMLKLDSDAQTGFGCSNWIRLTNWFWFFKCINI